MSRAHPGPLRALLGAAIVIVALLTLAPGANADERLRIHNLSVVGGNSWHAENQFALSWDPLAPASFAEVRSVDYRLRDSLGKQLGPVIRSGVAAQELRPVRIPSEPLPGMLMPGQYTIEVWLEGAGGDGPVASTTLRFDNARPTATRVLSPDDWVRAGAETVVKVEHPPPPLPASGIRGYAIVLDHGDGAVPCAGPTSCSEAETDLRAGIDDDTVSLGALSEGTNVAVVVAVSGSGLRSAVAGRTALHVDGAKPEAVLSGAPSGWSDRPVQLTVSTSDIQSGVAAAGPNGPIASISVDGGIPATAAGPSVTTSVRGNGSHRVTYFGRDAVGNSGEAQPASATVRIDETAPRLAFARAQNPAEPERIEATVSDSLSGPSPTTGSIDVRPADSAAQFEPIPTRVSAGRLIAFWDSDAYPAGSYEFKASGYDAAGNMAAANQRLDGTRMVLANPLKHPTEIEFGFGGRQMIWHRCAQRSNEIRCHREVISTFERRPSLRSIPYGRGVPVAGRLVSSSGSPLAGLAVGLTESFTIGATIRQRTTVVETGPDGVFLAHLLPGPSRGVQVSFAGTKLLSRAGSRTLQLGVRTAVRLHASSATAAIGGAPVIFSGQIPREGATIPAEGRPVELQFRVGDAPWSEFRTIQTDGHGRFRYPYAFSDDDSRGVRFQFRAYVPAQPGWPYEPGTSRPIAVTGR
jgi:hypothetical protein